MTVERRLADALHGADAYAPSADLFAKVQRSITEDRAHRRRIQRIVLAVAGGLAIAGGWIAAFIDISDGSVSMPWWSLELLTTAVMATLVIALGPAIRRFGRILVDEVFAGASNTSDTFLRLLDIAYYLVFGAYLLMSTSFSPATEWRVSFASQVEFELIRVGGLLLLLGVLHAINIASLPFVGLIHASNMWRAGRNSAGGEPSPEATTANRVANIIVLILTVPIALFIGIQIVSLIIGVFLGFD